MSEYTKQYKFTHDTRFDFNTSYTKDDSIRYLMGDLQGRLREDAQYAEYPDDFVELSYCEILELQQENAQTDYVNAKGLRKMFQKGMQDAGDKEVTDKQFAEIENRLNSTTEELAEYHKFSCDIVDELAKGNQSELRIDQNNTKNPAFPFITFASLKDWAKSKYPDSVATPPKKPARTKMIQQEDAILDAIGQLGYEPKCLPERVDGSSWVKSDVWTLKKNDTLFKNEKIFDNAWQRLRKKELIYEEGTLLQK